MKSWAEPHWTLKKIITITWSEIMRERNLSVCVFDVFCMYLGEGGGITHTPLAARMIDGHDVDIYATISIGVVSCIAHWQLLHVGQHHSTVIGLHFYSPYRGCILFRCQRCMLPSSKVVRSASSHSFSRPEQSGIFLPNHSAPFWSAYCPGVSHRCMSVKEDTKHQHIQHQLVVIHKPSSV